MFIAQRKSNATHLMMNLLYLIDCCPESQTIQSTTQVINSFVWLPLVERTYCLMCNIFSASVWWQWCLCVFLLVFGEVGVICGDLLPDGGFFLLVIGGVGVSGEEGGGNNPSVSSPLWFSLLVFGNNNSLVLLPLRERTCCLKQPLPGISSAGVWGPVSLSAS